jgi:hypothetical protein
MDDFSRPRLKGAVQKVGVSKAEQKIAAPVSSGHAVQVAWHPDLKVRESGKKKKRKGSAKKKRKPAEEQPRLFDEE